MTEQQTNEAEERKPTRTRRPSSEGKDESSERKRTVRSSDKAQSTTQKRPQRQSAERTSESSQRSSADSEQKRPAKPKPKLSAREAAVAALEQLQLLTTRTPESVTGVEPHDDGWRVTVEVVESARLPDTADIMAEYDVDIDGSGELAGYTRGSRYFRGRTREE